MKLLNILLVILLLLLVRKLAWCLRWLWCYYHGQETPAPISFLPGRTGETFEGHIRQARGDEEEQREVEENEQVRRQAEQAKQG